MEKQSTWQSVLWPTLLSRAALALLCGALAWAGTLAAQTSDVSRLMDRQAEHAATLKSLPDRYVPRAELMTALRSIEQRLQRIETKLDRRLARGGP
jgi:septal ring factor EnvC (AmiA/AmiB activator)